MSNEKKISLYLRGDNLERLDLESKSANRKRNDVINIAIENYLNCSISIKSDLLEFLKANPKSDNKQITEYLNSL